MFICFQLFENRLANHISRDRNYCGRKIQLPNAMLRLNDTKLKYEYK